MVLFLIFIVHAPVNAEFITGTILVEYWQAHKKTNAGNVNRNADAGFYRGYIIGVVDSFNNKLFTVPRMLKSDQIFTIVGNWLEKHPGEWNRSAADLTVQALQAAFPASKK